MYKIMFSAHSHQLSILTGFPHYKLVGKLVIFFLPVLLILENPLKRTTEMAEQVTVLATQPDDLRLVP